MKINIIGAGPAGMYFAIDVKKRVPSAEVTVLEKKPQQGQNGLGYVLQKPLIQDLYAIDRSVKEHLWPQATEEWDRVEIEAKGLLVEAEFSPSVGITRANLVSYLRGLAVDSGVEIKYEINLSSQRIDNLRRDSDLLVGADGIHSIVRETYQREFQSYTTDSTNSFVWLVGQRERNLMRFVVGEDEETVFVATTYPIDSSTEAVIIEGCTNNLVRGEIGKRETAAELEELGALLKTPYTNINLPPQSVHWKKNKLNGCSRLSFGNVALIGEAGFSSHYFLGGGLVLAFGAAHTLATMVEDSANPEGAAQAYSNTIMPWLREAQASSVRRMQWLERIDECYKRLDPHTFIFVFTNVTNK